MNRRIRRIATGAAAGIASVSVATAIAAPKEKTFSTGDIDKGVTHQSVLVQSLKVKPKGKIKDINAFVAFETNSNADYTMVLRHPSGKSIQLTSGNGGSGNGYTATFDDEADDLIEETEGVDTFLGETYRPEQWDDFTGGGLRELDGKKLQGKWQLIVIDTTETGLGSLEQFDIQATYKPTD
jgi:subtilisin-like proprotein convertase family protein